MNALHPGPTRIELRLLGPPELLIDGVALAFERRKALALLAYLAMEPGDHPRDRLADLLAPEALPASARAGLRRALVELTAVRPWLVTEGDRIGLHRDAAFQLDVEQFRRRLAGEKGLDELAAAVVFYRDDFMAGFELPDSAGFEEWQFFQREQLRSELAGALEQLSRLEPPLPDLEQAISYARRWLALDPLHEPAHRRLMRLYAAAGQPAAALRQYRVLVETLERELGAAPEEASAALHEQLRLGDRAALGSRWTSAPPRLPSAPAQSSAAIEISTLPFLGREEELARIAAALADPACRMLTLIGPGGMGKTRLAVQATSMHQEQFPDGIYQISLVGVNSSERLLTTFCVALGIAAQHEPLERLIAALQQRRALLLLDNLDQTLDSAPLLRTLIHRTRHLKLLITSRERLQLQEEWVIDLGGLAVPDEALAGDALNYSAVQLFAQRARQVRADFELSPAILPDVVEICRLVEGMPLAIELAAAWVRVLSPAEIARELAQNMALLTTNLRDVPERHRSVEGVFSQSWERLGLLERQALSRLSIFDNGFTRSGATEVAGANPLILAGLADKALVRRDRSGRYAIHELLRQFAARKLAADPADEQATALRFCRFCMRLLEQRGNDLQGPHQRQALDELEAEYDNLWAAWHWAVAHRRLNELALGLDGFYRLHELRGWYTDGIQALGLLTETLERDAPDPPLADESALLLARGRTRLGMLFCWVGQFARAAAELDAALPVLEHGRAALDVAFTLTALGVVAGERDDDEQALRRLEAGLAAYQALDHQPGVAWAIDALGDLAGSMGQYERARELFNESSTIFSALGDQVGAAWSLCSLGRVLGLMGEHAAARQLLEESLTLFLALGDQHGAATAHANLGEITAQARDLPAARAHWVEALALAREVGAMPLVIDSLVGAAQVLAQGGELEQAHELAALALEHPAIWQETIATAQEVYTATGSALGPQPAEQAARRGRVTPWETAAARLINQRG